MTQAAKIIDITRSFVIVDPRTFPETLHATAREDFPENRVPVVPYKGFNFLPTAMGYKSYFGVNAQLDISALTSRVDKIFLVQTKTFENILIALCEDGIWKKQGDSTGAWTQLVSMTVPAVGSHIDWSYTTNGQDVYAYRAGDAQYYKLASEATPYGPDEFASTASNLAETHYAATSGLAAGTYTYKIATKNVNAAISAPSIGVDVVLSATSVVNITWDQSDTDYGARIYRISGLTIQYKDLLASPTYHGFYDDNTGWTALESFPDTDWVAYKYYAFDAVPVVPTFLNMEGQIGIFNAGSRIGFWDSENSISWSSIDDFAEFTPSLETLAGSAIFNDIKGRVINILSHRDGFVVYATKSIVKINKRVDATFLWDPSVVWTDSGIAFPEQVCAAVPNDTHFAWTSTALVKIDISSKAEIIVPEVYDYLSKSDQPIFLQLLEGRYLCLEVLDPEYIDGQIELTVGAVNPITYNFDTSTSPEEENDAFVLTGNDACYSYALMEAAHLAAGEAIINSGGGPGNYPDGPAKNWLRSYYTAYFSRSYVSENPTFGPTPCPTVGPDGVEYNLSPVGNTGKLETATQDATNKWIIEEIPGDLLSGFDTEQFLAWQLAIWRKEDEAREAFLAAILNRAAIAEAVGTTTTGFTSFSAGQDGSEVSEGVHAPVVNICNIGDYIAGAGAPFWGMNNCSFWVSRYITKKITIDRIKSVTNTETVIRGTRAWYDSLGGAAAPAVNIPYGSPQGPCQANINSGGAGGPTNVRIQKTIPNGIYPSSVQNWITAKPGGSISPDPFLLTYASEFQPWTKHVRDIMYAYNRGTPSGEGIYAVDTGYLQLKGWWYTDKNGAVRTIAASPTCARPNLTTPSPKTPSGGSFGTPGSKYGGVPIDDSGSICGIPFDPVTYEYLAGESIEWPATEVTLPAGDFLLQNGSIGPIYPDFYGAFVYDLQLKKWGKMRCPHKRLLDYSPINNISGGIIPYEVFGIHGGIIDATGKISLFDRYPFESYITYGKIGYSRLGFTNLEEVKTNFADLALCTVSVEGSLDGKNLQTGLYNSQYIDNANEGILASNLSARWFNVSVEGIFDLTHLEFRGTFAGRR